MGKLAKTLITLMLVGALAACGSDGTVSDGGGGTDDVSFCVTRTLRTVYANECDFDVNVIVFELGAVFFRVNANRAVTRTASGNSFGACRVPQEPVLNASSSGFTCQ